MNENNKINDFKPRKWLVVILIIIALAIAVILINKGITVYQERMKKMKSSSNFGEKVSEKYNEINNQINESRKKSQIDSFNSKFEMYTGTEIGNSVAWLLDDIITNNKKNQDHLITVVFKTYNTTNPEELTSLKKELEDWHKYEVSLDYDEEGYANKATINE